MRLNHRLVAFITIFISGVLASCGGARDSISSVPATTNRPGVIMIGDPTLLAMAGTDWQREVARRFPYSVVMLCHGQDLSGEFMCFPTGEIQSGEDVSITMDNLSQKYPGRTVVILSCNPEHIAVTGHPNCYYSTAETWVVPDRDVNDPEVQAFAPLKIGPKLHTYSDDPFSPSAPTNRWATDPDVTGNVFELVEAK